MQSNMKNPKLIKLLGTKGYKRVTLETDNGEPKTYYTYRRGLHINATKDLSFHIVPPSQSLGLGRFAICATENGESSQLGTDYAPFFFQPFLAFLEGERNAKEIMDKVCNGKRTG